MATDAPPINTTPHHDKDPESAPEASDRLEVKRSTWRRFLGGKRKTPCEVESSGTSTDGTDDIKAKSEKWSLGVLNDKETEEVPGMSMQTFLPHRYLQIAARSVKHMTISLTAAC